jgi:hypothetical protein
VKVDRDVALNAVVRRCIPLRYSSAEPPMGRPAHVRAGSGLCWVGGRLAVIQDDAAFLGLIDPAGGSVEAIALPAQDRVRLWGDALGNKALKPDLEACVALGEDGLLAFGSGSTAMRERLLRVTGIGGAVRAGWLPVPALYAALRAATGFSGSEMNIEGAALMGGTVRLFNRGNGAARGALTPVDATCDLSLDALLAFLDGAAPPPDPDRITGYDLGRLEGGRLGFTDAAVRGDTLLYCAAAEASSDTYRDGPVLGSVIGFLGSERAAWTPVTHPGGALFAAKVEGIAAVPGHEDRLWAVLDRDDPEVPSELCEIVLTGPWPP